MTTNTAQQTIIPMHNVYFTKGYHLGRCWFFHGEPELPVDDVYLIDNVMSYCQHRLHNDPEWLAERLGFIIGMVSGSCIPESPNE